MLEWVLLFHMWVEQPNGKFEEQEVKKEFATAEDCRTEGRKLVRDAGEKNPANYFCFRKGEKY